MARLPRRRTNFLSLGLATLTAAGIAGAAGAGAWGFSDAVARDLSLQAHRAFQFVGFGAPSGSRLHAPPFPSYPLPLPIPNAPSIPRPQPLSQVRALDGKGNNPNRGDYGSAGVRLNRVTPPAYADGLDAPAGSTRKSPRIVSNLVVAQSGDIPNQAGISDFFWQWGQFLDHDMDLTPEHGPEEPFEIAVPPGDPSFDPHYDGGKTIAFKRSTYDPSTGRGYAREQVNKVTAFIDASNVYGSDEARAHALRTNDGTGRLKTTQGGLYLPYNTDGLDNAGGKERKDLFLAGDVRANEQVGLTAVHTLFVREHNRLAAGIAASSPYLSGDEIYETARKIVGAQMQVITYREFLPILLGPNGVGPYYGYNPSVDPGIATEFSTAAFRFGHSMVSPAILLVDARGRPTGELQIKDAFFDPSFLPKTGVEPVLRGLAAQPAQRFDRHVIDGLRNFLFGEPGSDGLDLASLNIQRGRDHGLADYNTVRRAYGLAPARSFADVTSDKATQKALAAAYKSVDDVDLWVGGLAEDAVPGAVVGPTFHTVLRDQFTRLRDGDRFWYQNDSFFTSNPKLLYDVQSTRLADVIRHNTAMGGELQDHVMRVTR